MLLLHTADLHLGRTLHERELLEDQGWALEAMVRAIAERKPAALLIAGDIYDRSIPTPEAIGLFDSFLAKALAARPGLVVVAIPGNHDSAARMAFGAGLFRGAGVHFRTRPGDCDEPIVVEAAGERVILWALPFLGPGAFADSEAGGPDGAAGMGSQAELFAEGVGRIRARLEPGVCNVLVAHCFAAGGATSESERGFVGLAEQVDLGLLESFDYSALGHLHRMQRPTERSAYPGSPLAYSFGESGQEKGFLLVEVGAGGSRTEFVPVKPLRRMQRIEGPFSELSAPGAHGEHREDFIEARLTDPLPVLNPADPLRANFPNLLSVRQAAFELQAPSTTAVEREERGLGAAMEDYLAFSEDMRGSAPSPAELEVFSKLLAEAERAAD
ncbi:MAG TPA: exonuclease SbcCD subunit D [Rectinemataceae bacterium]|nr:exonuclease SbcCD subunit D [Rectinemataceae bacterium]